MAAAVHLDGLISADDGYLVATSPVATAVLAPPASAGDSDAELITATRAGNDEAFGLLYRRHAGAARAAARAGVRSRAVAEDLVAESFTRVLAALRRGNGPDTAFRPYLLACVRNAGLDWRRRQRRHPVETDCPTDVPDPAYLLGDVAVLADERDMMARAFATLPARWQAVLWHTAVEGLSPADVAPILGLSPNAVAALGYRAREGLRQAYLQAHTGPVVAADCRATRDLLGRYVRDALAPGDRQRVEQHLECCQPCAALLVELRDVDTSLRSVLVPIIAGVPASAYLAGLGAAGMGAIGLGVGVGGLLGAGVLKLAVAAAAVLAITGGVVITASAGIGPRRVDATAVRPESRANATTADGAPLSEPGGPGSPARTPGDGGGVPPAPGATVPPAPGGPNAPTTTPALPGSSAPPGAEPPVAVGPELPVTVPGGVGGVPPSVTLPAVDLPDVDLPDVDLPDVDLPDVDLPGELPDIPLPDIPLPDVTLPDVTLPDVTLPDVTLPPVPLPPGVTVPPVTLPDVTVPDVTVPDVTVPPVTLPPVTLPSLPPPTLRPITLPFPP